MKHRQLFSGRSQRTRIPSSHLQAQIAALSASSSSVCGWWFTRSFGAIQRCHGTDMIAALAQQFRFDQG